MGDRVIFENDLLLFRSSIAYFNDCTITDRELFLYWDVKYEGYEIIFPFPQKNEGDYSSFDLLKNMENTILNEAILLFQLRVLYKRT